MTSTQNTLKAALATRRMLSVTPSQRAAIERYARATGTLRYNDGRMSVGHFRSGNHGFAITAKYIQVTGEYR